MQYMQIKSNLFPNVFALGGNAKHLLAMIAYCIN